MVKLGSKNDNDYVNVRVHVAAEEPAPLSALNPEYASPVVL